MISTGAPIRLHLRRFSRYIFPTHRQFIRDLERSLGSAETILDIGCGPCSPLWNLRRRRKTVGVDLHAPSLALSRAANIHDDYVQLDARGILDHFGPKSFDAVIALDFIEHLPRPDGLQLVNAMEHIARSCCVVFTPNGYLSQGPSPDNPLQEHLSGWTPQEFVDRGYDVTGEFGPRIEENRRRNLNGRSEPISFLLQRMTNVRLRSHPTDAFSFLAVRRM